MNDRFPLGSPLNRQPDAPNLKRIEGRPNWWRDHNGKEKYIEPEPEVIVPIPIPEVTYHDSGIGAGYAGGGIPMSTYFADMYDRIAGIDPDYPPAYWSGM